MTREEIAAEKHVNAVINYQDVFTSEKGEAVLFDLCKKFHSFSTSYQGDTTDCIFREGERNVINFILSQLQQDPAKLLKHFRERQAAEIDYDYE